MSTDRPFIFKTDSGEIVFPVSPGEYAVSFGNNMELINIHELGDAVLAGNKTASTINLSFLLPSANSHFSDGRNETSYVGELEQIVEQKQKVRFIVGNTNVNVLCHVESVSYGESDGTNDIYADIALRESAELEAVEMEFTGDQKKPRAAPQEKSGAEDYKIKKGDTISQLCKDKYGKTTPEMWDKLAKFNNISNRDLIYTGNNLKFPHPLV